MVQSFTACMPLMTATSTFRLGRRRWSSPQQCYLHCLHTYIYTERTTFQEIYSSFSCTLSFENTPWRRRPDVHLPSLNLKPVCGCCQTLTRSLKMPRMTPQSIFNIRKIAKLQSVCLQQTLAWHLQTIHRRNHEQILTQSEFVHIFCVTLHTLHMSTGERHVQCVWGVAEQNRRPSATHHDTWLVTRVFNTDAI